MNLLAILLATAECAGLFQTVPAQSPVSWSTDCLPPVADGTGAVAESCFGGETYHSVDGATLGSSHLRADFVAARARGFWATASLADNPSLLSIDRDGTLLGSLPAPAPGGDLLQRSLLLADPDGTALVLDVIAEPGASSSATPSSERPWQLVLRRVSATMSILDGPRVIDSGPKQAPSFMGKVSTDGSFVLTERGWHFPPLRNDQIAARWFDARGAPLTGWFAALDQAPVGGPALLLGDGSVIVEGRYRTTRLARDPQPAPPWLPSGIAFPFNFPPHPPLAFVLSDRIAVARPSATACGVDLEIRAPSGALCGSQALPFTPFENVCLRGLLVVGPEGTLLMKSSGDETLHVWPRLFAPAGRGP